MSNTTLQIVIAILTGGIGVGIVEGIREGLRWHRERKAKNEDRKAVNLDSWREETDKKMNALMESQMYLLYDRIKFLGQAYIADGEIDFDDRRILRKMHESYHDGLGGNGDLDALMKEVDKLPLKKEDKR